MPNRRLPSLLGFLIVFFSLFNFAFAEESPICAALMNGGGRVAGTINIKAPGWERVYALYANVAVISLPAPNSCPARIMSAPIKVVNFGSTKFDVGSISCTVSTGFLAKLSAEYPLPLTCLQLVLYHGPLLTDPISSEAVALPSPSESGGNPEPFNMTIDFTQATHEHPAS